MSLSLCMIVKNEEDNLPRCLESIKDIVNEMIIVDTGSTDSTVGIAKKYGAKVYHFTWNENFSDARNYSLKFASCDWILLMDADDELEKSDQERVLELINKNEADAYFFETISYIGKKSDLDIINNLNIRLIKNGKGYFFSNPIHEQIYSNIKAINPSAVILNESIKVYHYGCLNSDISSTDKRNRNISILEKELERYPDYGFALFNLGNEYSALGNTAKALEYYEKSYKKFDPAQGFSSKLVLKLANCYMDLGRYSDALTLIDKGLEYYPEFTDLEHMRGLIYNGSRMYVQAIENFNKCIAMGEASSYFNVIIGSGTYRSYYMLGEIYYHLECYGTAEENLKISIKYNPKFAPAVEKLIRLFCRKKAGRKQLTSMIESLRAGGPENFDSIACNSLMKEKCYELALSYLDKCENTSGASPKYSYNKGICKLLLKKYRSAYTIMESVKNDPEYLVRAVSFQILCRILEGKYASIPGIVASSNVYPHDMLLKVYIAFVNIMETGKTPAITDDEGLSAQYTVIIFDLLKILLILKEFQVFEKALNLLNAVNDKTIFLKLGKLYYEEECYSLAYKELIHSVKLFDMIDIEGAEMLHRLKLKGF